MLYRGHGTEKLMRDRETAVKCALSERFNLFLNLRPLIPVQYHFILLKNHHPLLHSNQMQALRPIDRNIGTMRETFFVSMLKPRHYIYVPAKGDFLVDDTWTFEVGGSNKGSKQI
jgi:hypothetical protein